MSYNFKYREMTPDDGDNIKDLCKESPDTGSYSYYPDFHINPYHGLSSQYPDNLGIVVECDDHDGVVAVGDSIFGKCFFNGKIRNFAFLKAYHVHLNYRRYKIGTGIQNNLVKMAQQKKGDDVLITGVVQTDNIGQIKMLKKTGVKVHNMFHSGIFSLSKSQPKHNNNYNVERAETKDYEEIANNLNNFYQGYNLYEPQTAESLNAWVENPICSVPFCHYYIVKDKKDNILAGIGIVEEYRVRTFVVIDYPFKMKIVNPLLNIIPNDNIIRQLIGVKIWYKEDSLEAGQYLFNTVRWKWKDMANIFICHYDPRSTISKMIKLPKWRPKVQYYSMSPEQMDDNLICPII